ncbi:beta-glucosidase family protein [Agromyces aureus]|uniref:Exo-alpha-(1->6)-L-arabinopyranosidase n=1 Tax=Agromyces aureus TaxID=453304 RepID=A0A191WFZ7_9MICO|nr:glycoside hydrolase family 3 N-terminal domain-containing protein [Agromyces aureus]ANJ27181.1 glycosyl hydrolase [Agromyces aureus]
MEATQTQERVEIPTTGTPDERASRLAAQLTVEEKAQQLVGIMPFGLVGPQGIVPAAVEQALGGGIGHVSGIGMFGSQSAPQVAASVNALQRYLVENTRAGIPAIFHNEALNGVVAPGFTSFPTAIALAATWNPNAVEEMAELIRHQMRTVGLTQALSPVLDVARDARWGRVHETYGEDPYLATAFGVAFIRGLQGEDLDSGVIATAKHFLGYSVTEAGQNMAGTAVTRRELREVYARPFEAAIRLADLASVMNSYSTIDGVPVAASPAILRGLLRDELGFTGTVVSDYMTTQMLVERNEVAEDKVEAAALALAAGLDVELPNPYAYGPVLAGAVRGGRIAESQLNEAVHRALRDKFALGLFEHPYASEDPIEISEVAGRGGELAVTLANQSVTLLKNDGDVLPLSAVSRRIAVLGPHAESAYTAFAAYTQPAGIELMKVMMSGGMGNMAGVDAPTDVPDDVAAEAAEAMAAFMSIDLEAVVRGAYGARSLTDALRDALPAAEIASVVTPLRDEDWDPADALRAAADADVIVLALGGRSSWLAGAVGGTEGEGVDTADIDLPAIQVRLAQEAARSGKPVVAVVQMGRPYALSSIEDSVSAIVTAYFGGPEQGRALASVLTGAANPGGKLPFTIPRTSGQVPIHSGQHLGSGYRRSETDMHQGYQDQPATPLYAFGHGLSYTTFEYGSVALADAAVTTSGTVSATISITNTGAVSGEEVVQAYVADRARGVTRPAQQLVAFARVALAAGESKRVTVEFDLSQLAYIGLEDDGFVFEPGAIEVSFGAASDDLRQSARVEVTGQTVNVGADRSFLARVSVE